MFKIFNSNVFIEIGQAIGNVRRKLKKRSDPELVDRLFRKKLKEYSLELPDAPGRFMEPEDEVIDVEYRVLQDTQEEP